MYITGTWRFNFSWNQNIYFPHLYMYLVYVAKSGLISTILGIINASFNNFFPQSRHLIAEILSKRLKAMFNQRIYQYAEITALFNITNWMRWFKWKTLYMFIRYWYTKFLQNFWYLLSDRRTVPGKIGIYIILHSQNNQRHNVHLTADVVENIGLKL